MAALTHFVKTDITARTSTSTTGAELTNYTITWANLTGAGFAASDDVLIFVAVKEWGASANISSRFSVGFGTTYAGRTDDASSVSMSEPASTANGDQYIWFDRRTLTVNENIYFTGGVDVAGTASYNEFVCFVLKLGDLASTDWLYAEDAGSAQTDAWPAYVDGAGAATGALGDWFLMACTLVAIDESPGNRFLAINDGTSDICEVLTEGEVITDERAYGTFAYRASLGSGVTVRARYKADDTRTTQFRASKIFGLRLDAFQDHAGAHTTNTITHSVVDTYQEFAGFGSYGLGTTGPFMVFGWPITTLTLATQRPYGRIQIANADWPVANANRLAVCDNFATPKIAPLLFGYAASQSSGTLDIDLDTADDAATGGSCTTQVAVAFSLTLPGAAPKSLLIPPISPAMMSVLVR